MKASRRSAKWVPALIVVAIVILLGVIFSLGRLAIIYSDRSSAEKERADVLQQSVDALGQRTDQNRKFFELVRELIITQDAADRQALIDKLREFQFTAPETLPSTTTTTTTTVKPKATTTTSAPTARASPVTSQPSTPPATQPPQSPATTSPPTPPSTLICVSLPDRKICR